MNGNLLKKLLAMAMITLFLTSTGAIAAEKKCQKGYTYDNASGKCKRTQQ
jgi:hypothetical protein